MARLFLRRILLFIVGPLCVFMLVLQLLHRYNHLYFSKTLFCIVICLGFAGLVALGYYLFDADRIKEIKLLGPKEEDSKHIDLAFLPLGLFSLFAAAIILYFFYHHLPVCKLHTIDRQASIASYNWVTVDTLRLDTTTYCMFQEKKNRSSGRRYTRHYVHLTCRFCRPVVNRPDIWVVMVSKKEYRKADYDDSLFTAFCQKTLDTFSPIAVIGHAKLENMLFSEDDLASLSKYYAQSHGNELALKPDEITVWNAEPQEKTADKYHLFSVWFPLFCLLLLLVVFYIFYRLSKFEWTQKNTIC